MEREFKLQKAGIQPTNESALQRRRDVKTGTSPPIPANVLPLAVGPSALQPEHDSGDLEEETDSDTAEDGAGHQSSPENRHVHDSDSIFSLSVSSSPSNLVLLKSQHNPSVSDQNLTSVSSLRFALNIHSQNSEYSEDLVHVA